MLFVLIAVLPSNRQLVGIIFSGAHLHSTVLMSKYIHFHIHQSTTTLKLLTGEVKKTDDSVVAVKGVGDGGGIK